MKVTVVGAGNVGATCADVLAKREVANEIILLDIKEGFAEGKALDIWEASPIILYDSRTIGSTNDYSKTANSDVVVITSRSEEHTSELQSRPHLVCRLLLEKKNTILIY